MADYKTRHGKLIEDPMQIMEFVTGGNSVFTIKNVQSGNRATYKAVKPDLDGALFEVWAFNGSNNQRKTDYKMMGVVNPDGDFKVYGWADAAAALLVKIEEGPKGHWVDDKAQLLESIVNGKWVSSSMEYRLRGACNKYGVPKVGEVRDSVKLKAFPWVWDKIRYGGDLPKVVEVWHEGGCCRCAHKLSVPASIEMGMGPDCAGVLGRSDEWNALNTKLGKDLVAYAEGLAKGREAA